jgi:carboxypeptidase A4
MKVSVIALASLGLASAASVAKKVSYDDWKVYRVEVGSNAAKLNEVVDKLQLELWKGKPSTSSVVDIMVPPSVVQDFETSTKGMDTKVMHENLGSSIVDEQNFSIYAGNYDRAGKFM